MSCWSLELEVAGRSCCCWPDLAVSLAGLLLMVFLRREEGKEKRKGERKERRRETRGREGGARWW
uniref:Putative ovule protein n=1 Tax=Solanum chacoense TaxID=4108 RepID=A0A0V0GEY5_SOLCH